MNTFRALGSLTLSTALVATAAVLVIAATAPVQAAPAPMTVHAAPSATQLRQLATDVQGSYALADGRTLRVWREAGVLRAQVGDEPAIALQSDGRQRLRSDDGRTTLSFRSGPDGRAYAVTLAQAR